MLNAELVFGAVVVEQRENAAPNKRPGCVHDLRCAGRVLPNLSYSQFLEITARPAVKMRASRAWHLVSRPTCLEVKRFRPSHDVRSPPICQTTLPHTPGGPHLPDTHCTSPQALAPAWTLRTRCTDAKPATSRCERT